MNIRPEKPEDIKNIWRINADAFETDAEADLVDSLREKAPEYISIVYENNDGLVGHIFLSPVEIIGDQS